MIYRVEQVTIMDKYRRCSFHLCSSDRNNDIQKESLYASNTIARITRYGWSDSKNAARRWRNE